MPQIQYLVSTQDATKLYSWQTNCFDDLTSSLAREFPSLGDFFTVSYFDEEGDSIKVTSDPEFDEALNYAKQSEFFLPIMVTKEEAPAPAPQEEEKEPAPEEANGLFNAEDFLKRFCGSAEESSDSNPFFRAIAEGANFPQEIEQAAQNFLPMLSPFVDDLFSALRGEAVSVPPPAPAPVSSPAPVAEPCSYEVAVVPEEQVEVHHPAICDSCEASIRGIRYKCLVCPDYDLCEACEATNLEKQTHDGNHVFAKIRDPAQRNSPIFRQQRPLFRGGCGRGKFGGRRRVEKLENDVALLQEQVAALLAKRQAEQKEEPAPVPVEDEGILIEDVPEEENSEDISVNIQPMVEEPAQEEQNEDVDPAVRELLQLLESMGFADAESNLAVLAAHDNNVEQALEALLNGSF